jgi:hypothetical protein
MEVAYSGVSGLDYLLQVIIWGRKGEELKTWRKSFQGDLRILTEEPFNERYPTKFPEMRTTSQLKITKLQ